MHKDFRADLHSHTTCSDGSDAPLALLHLAKQVGLSALSITDHDTVDAYTPELFKEAAKLSLQILPGVEISSMEGNTSVHILGYGFDLNADSLHHFLRQIQTARTERNQIMVKKLQKHGVAITEEELMAFAPHRTVGRPHMAALMVQKGYAASIADAFDRYLKESACCYVPGFKHTPKEVIEEIHKAGGKAVLAHPHFIRKDSLVKKLLQLPFDGIECYYALLDKHVEAPWVKLAKARGLIATGGSDYHGKVKPQIPLGCSWVGEETFFTLLSSLA